MRFVYIHGKYYNLEQLKAWSYSGSNSFRLEFIGDKDPVKFVRDKWNTDEFDRFRAYLKSQVSTPF